jgi:hypothetical protein
MKGITDVVRGKDAPRKMVVLEHLPFCTASPLAAIPHIMAAEAIIE